VAGSNFSYTTHLYYEPSCACIYAWPKYCTCHWERFLESSTPELYEEACAPSVTTESRPTTPYSYSRDAHRNPSPAGTPPLPASSVSSPTIDDPPVPTPDTLSGLDTSSDCQSFDGSETPAVSAVGSSPQIPSIRRRGKLLACEICGELCNGSKGLKRHLGPAHDCGTGWACPPNTCKKSMGGRMKVAWRLDNFSRHLEVKHADTWPKMSKKNQEAFLRQCAGKYLFGRLLPDPPTQEEWDC